MGQGDVGFLHPLFELAGSLLDEDDPENLSFGLGEIGAQSPLARDDAGLDGSWVSMVATHGIGAALDHAVALRSLVLGAKEVTINAPWTLLRGVLEPASFATWVLSGNGRARRRERALRVWYNDYNERSKWEIDSMRPAPTPPVKTGRQRAAAILELAKKHELRETQVSASSDTGTRLRPRARPPARPDPKRSPAGGRRPPLPTGEPGLSCGSPPQRTPSSAAATSVCISHSMKLGSSPWRGSLPTCCTRRSTSTPGSPLTSRTSSRSSRESHRWPCSAQML